MPPLKLPTSRAAGPPVVPPFGGARGSDAAAAGVATVPLAELAAEAADVGRHDTPDRPPVTMLLDVVPTRKRAIRVVVAHDVADPGREFGEGGGQFILFLLFAREACRGWWGFYHGLHAHLGGLWFRRYQSHFSFEFEQFHIRPRRLFQLVELGLEHVARIFFRQFGGSFGFARNKSKSGPSIITPSRSRNDSNCSDSFSTSFNSCRIDSECDDAIR